MIVDSHVHLLPERLAKAVRGFFDEHHPVQFAYPLDPLSVLDRMYEAGVRQVWNLPYAHKPGITDDLNQSMASLVHTQLRDHPVDVVIGCTTHPDDPRRRDIRRAVGRYGARVLKLHCSVGNFAADDPGLDVVYEDAADMRIPVVIHAGRPISGRTPHGDLEPLDRALRSHPETTFILAHTGHPSHRAALELMHRHDNLWSDITPVLDEHMPASAMEIEAVADRLLFGSDAPNTTVPVEELHAWLLSLSLRPETLEAICAGNAQRLIELANDRNANSH